MNDSDRQAASARSPLAAALFGIIFVLLLPVFLIGYGVWVIGWIMERKSDVSRTAQAPLTGRWFQHMLSTRQDEPANQLIMVSGVPTLALRLVAGPLLLAHRLSGYVPKMFSYPFEGEITLSNQGAARQTFYDNVIERYLADIEQFVILGAGFDTRALRLKGVPRDASVRSFEIDTPATQVVKCEMLAKVGIDSTGITFVSADFETEDWLTNLIDASFDPNRPALFICEGVTPYLDREAVEDTLRKIARTARGSVVAFDYFTTEVLESDALMMRSIRASLNAGGEPLKFGIDSTPPSRERAAELLQSCGLSLVEQRTLGSETGGKRAWGGFAIASVK